MASSTDRATRWGSFGHGGGAPLGGAAAAQEPAGPALRDAVVLGRVDPIAGASDNARDSPRAARGRSRPRRAGPRAGRPWPA